jgi:hypothetical protein
VISTADTDPKKTQNPWSFGVFAANFDRAMAMISTKPQLRIQPPREGTEPAAQLSVDRAGTQTARGQAGDAGSEPLDSQGFAASPIDLEAVLLAFNHAPNVDGVMALVKSFLETVEAAFSVDAAPVEVLTAVFGAESVAVVADVAVATVVTLEAEAAATGGVITDRATSRIARDMVRRGTMRAARGVPGPLRLRSALGVRVRRAPRAHRAHRRAVRLSAVASAGDGPPPGEPPAARSRLDSLRISLASGWPSCELATEVVHVNDTLERAIEASQ